jgi:hypothetical protein
MEMNTWLADEAFFNRGSEVWISPDGISIPVKWKFTRYKSLFMGFHAYSCELEALGLSALGLGSAESPLIAARKAFAESWERFWMLKESNDQNKIISSNGFAAGATNAQSMRNSRIELVERKIFLDAWKSMQGWRRSSFDKLKHKLLLLNLRARGWDTYLFEISSNLGNLMACLAVHPNHGAAFDIALSGISNDVDLSLLRAVSLSTYALKNQAFAELPNNGRPEDHARFYSQPIHLKAFDFLLKPSSESTFTDLEISNSDSIITKQIVHAGNFPAVAKSYHPTWEPLSWGKVSIKGKNPWPHPLA